ncbi:hypothetical protein CA615_01095 [Methanosphaera stadtmanae]|uniref:Uncharacterized protein n=5 Tax=Methanosphaera TaxID=2316 RepID=A0A328QAH3_9EURY|nr:hypothetical protein CA615_01095 [Methanosphaera stadtmanae]
MNIYRNICTFNMENEEVFYKKLHETILNYYKTNHTDYLLNLTSPNMEFYRILLKSKSKFEVDALYKINDLKLENEKLSREVNKLTKLLKEEKNLKNKEIKQNKKIRHKLDEVLNSNSWKLMNGFRMIGLYKSVALVIFILLLIISIMIILIIKY